MNWLLVVCVVLSHNPARLALCKVEDLHNTRRQKDLFNCVFVDFGVQCNADMMLPMLYVCMMIPMLHYCTPPQPQLINY